MIAAQPSSDLTQTFRRISASVMHSELVAQVRLQKPVLFAQVSDDLMLLVLQASRQDT
jgi:hypothetical protein